MKNHTPSHGITLNAVLEFVGKAFKNLFRSSHNRDFQRLKNFIAS